jgi:hypothetical protein
MNRNKLKLILLKQPIFRELLFFLFQKKVYKDHVDKKIKKLLDGKLKLSGQKVDNLIISVTSIPSRIFEIKYMIFSVLNQSIRPEKIILWLTKNQFPLMERELPLELLELCKYDFEIHWYEEDIRSYTKLIPALKYFSKFFIVIADDDIYYRKRWLEKLWRDHLKYPNDIICHVADKICFDGRKKVMPYKKWQKNINMRDTSPLYFPLGVGGVLYQKILLFKDTENAELFLKLSPYADDLWFYFMIVLSGHTVRIVKNSYTNMKYINPYKEYNIIHSVKLSAINMDNDKNDEQFENILNYYRDLYFLFTLKV